MKTTDYIISRGLFERNERPILIDFEESVKTKGYDFYVKNKYSTLIFSDAYIRKEYSYSFNGEIIGVIPHQLEFLLPIFKESESIMKIENDWDYNDNLTYEFQTWKAAIHFLLDYSVTLLNDFNTIIDKPKIYNGPSASIDILWEYDSYTFLVNIAKDGLNASFYADNTINTQRIRGEFKLNNFKKTLIPFAIQF